MPSIKDVVQKSASQTNVKEPVVAAPEPSQPVAEESQPAAVPSQPLEPSMPKEEEPEKEETLEGNWDEVVDAIFQNLPMLYYTLKRTSPTLKEGTLTVEVANNIQEEELDQRKRAVLEYWRNHFKMDVDDFVIVVNENKVTETAVLTSDEQFQHMKEQNPGLLSFLQTLNFRMKY